MAKPILLVIGVGPATGRTLCRHVADQYRLVLVARSRNIIDPLVAELPDAIAYIGDVGEREDWPKVLEQIVSEVGLPSRVLVNTESAAWGEYHQLSLDKLATSFDVNATGLLQTVQTLFPDSDNIPSDTRFMISSSPAAYNPPSQMLGLAPSRVAQRVIAELLNEILAEKGLKFSVFSIDGAIDEVKMRTMFPDKPTSYFIQPGDIAKEIARLFEAQEFPLASGISGESSFSKRGR